MATGDLAYTPFNHQHPFPPDLRMQRDTINARDVISAPIRWEGMLVYVLENQKTYQLQGGLTNEYWVEFLGSGVGDISNAVLYTIQNLTPEQQLQARLNIGAGELLDGLISLGAVSSNVNDVTIASVEARINGVIVGQNSPVTINVPPPTEGYTRRDLIVIGSDSIIYLVQGVEVLEGETAITPDVPEDTVVLLETFSNDTGLDDFEEFALSTFVRFDVNTQNLSDEQKRNATTNAGAIKDFEYDTKIGGLDLLHETDLRRIDLSVGGGITMNSIDGTARFMARMEANSLDFGSTNAMLYIRSALSGTTRTVVTFTNHLGEYIFSMLNNGTSHFQYHAPIHPDAINLNQSATLGQVISLIEGSEETAFTELSGDDFFIGYRVDGATRQEVIFDKTDKDVIITDVGNIILNPSQSVGNFIFTGNGDSAVTEIRGIEGAVDGREIHLTNRSGAMIPIIDSYVGGPANSAFGYAYNLADGETISNIGDGGVWELNTLNQVAFSDNIDSVNAKFSTGSDGLKVITDLQDKSTGEDVVFKETTGTPTPDGVIYVLVNGVYYKRSFTVANILWYGTKGDNLTDNYSLIDQCLTSTGTYGKILIPEGIFCVSNRIIPKEGQEIEFKGWLKLISPSVIINSVMTVSADNVILKNPLLDMNKDNIMHSPTVGTQSTFTQGANSSGLRIYGGELKNGVHNIFQGGGSDTIVYGTLLQECGEHIVYMNGVDTNKNITFDKCILKNPARISTMGEGHYMQIRNYDQVKINGCISEGGSELIPVCALNITDSSNIKVTNSEFKNVNHSFVVTDNLSSNIKIDNCNFDKNDTTLRNSSITDVQATNIVFNNCNFDGGSINNYQPDLGFNRCRFTNVEQEISPLTTVNLLNCDIKFSSTHTATRIAHLTTGSLYAKGLKIDFGGKTGTAGLAHNGATEPLYVDDLEIKGYTGGNIVALYLGSGHRLRKVKITDNSSTSAIRVFAPPTDVLIEDAELTGGINMSAEQNVLIRNSKYNTQSTFSNTLQKNGNTYYEWIDSSGFKRIKNSKPTTLFDGIITGSDIFVSLLGSRHESADGINLVGTFSEGTISYRNIISGVNFPASEGQVRTFNGASALRTYSIFKESNSNNIYIQSYNISGVGQGWSKISTGITILSASPTLDFGDILAGESATLTATVTGAALLDNVNVSGPASIYSANATIDSWVSSTDTVSLRVRNFGGTTINPASGTFNIKVFK